MMVYVLIVRMSSLSCEHRAYYCEKEKCQRNGEENCYYSHYSKLFLILALLLPNTHTYALRTCFQNCLRPHGPHSLIQISPKFPHTESSEWQRPACTLAVCLLLVNCR